MGILMHAPGVVTRAGTLAILMSGAVCLTAATSGCGTPLGPTGCEDQTGTVFEVRGTVPAQGTMSYFVTSPWNSNLVIKLTWQDATPRLGLRATIVECGGHTGCGMYTSIETGRAKLDEGLVVDGWVGKTYRIDVLGDSVQAQAFQLVVLYDVSCES